MDNLYYLVRMKRFEEVRALLAGHPDPKALVNKVDERGMSALFQAVSDSNPSLEMIELLLENGADPNFIHVKNMPGFTMPEGKSKFFLFRWFRKLFGIKDDNDYEDFLELGISSFEPSEYRESLQSKAIHHGNLELVKLLQKYGTDFLYIDENGYTSLIFAAGTGNEVLIEYLLSLGIDINAKSSYGESALRSEYHCGNFKIVSRLLEAGADESELKWTPLIRAVAIGTEQDVERELAHSPDLKATDVWGDSALHVALKRVIGVLRSDF